MNFEGTYAARARETLETAWGRSLEAIWYHSLALCELVVMSMFVETYLMPSASSRRSWKPFGVGRRAKQAGKHRAEGPAQSGTNTAKHLSARFGVQSDFSRRRRSIPCYGKMLNRVFVRSYSGGHGQYL